MFRSCLLLACVSALTLLAPSAAFAGASQDYLEVYKAYQQAGVVNGCDFSAKKLASARKGVPPDIDTYAPDFPDALDAALRQRSSGACDKQGASSGAGSSGSFAASGGASASGGGAVGGGTSAGGGLPGAGPGADGAPADPAAAAATPGLTPAPAPEAFATSAAADGSVAAAATRRTGATEADGAPLPLVLLAALAILAALAALVWALARFFGIDPPWLVSSRHASAEAGWRVSNSWAEFGDWLRFGR